MLAVFQRAGGSLKAAVLEVDWFDPTLNPKMADFARHYGTVVLPTQPARATASA